eukprot:gene15157-64141_t
MQGRYFRIAEQQMGDGMRMLLGYALRVDLAQVDVKEMGEVTLIHWNDAAEAFTVLEQIRNEKV